MNETFDIFLRKEDGSFVWVGPAESFALARETVVQNPDSSDYAFLIVNAATGEKTLIEPPEKLSAESPARQAGPSCMQNEQGCGGNAKPVPPLPENSPSNRLPEVPRPVEVDIVEVLGR